MSSYLILKARGVSDIKCHLMLTTKSRQKVITDLILVRIEEIFQNLMAKWEGRLVEFNGERDHVHLLLQYTPQTERSQAY
jgi:putative transposase